MALPVSPEQLISIIKKGVEIYNKIKHDVPDQIEDVTDRMVTGKMFLELLEKDIVEDNALMKTSPEAKSFLQLSLAKMKDVLLKIVAILEEYHKNRGEGAFAAVKKLTAKAYFAYGGKSDELERLTEKLILRQDEVQLWRSKIQEDGINALVSAVAQPKKVTGPGSRTDYNIIFVDSDNIGRSVIAEAYAALCREWTERTGGVWRIKHIHSAGYYVKSRSSTAPLQEQLGSHLFEGNRPPVETGMSALFDNIPIKHAYKGDIQKQMMQRRSRGLSESMFATFDFLLVFNRHILARLEILRNALARKHGQSAPAGKGTLVLLGQYGSTRYKEIWQPEKGSNSSESSDNWGATVENIKTSFRGFLEQELRWTQPAAGAIQKV